MIRAYAACYTHDFPKPEILLKTMDAGDIAFIKDIATEYQYIFTKELGCWTRFYADARPNATWITVPFQSYIPVEYDENNQPILHDYISYKCSRCGRTEKVKEPYCNCGAKMDLED